MPDPTKQLLMNTWPYGSKYYRYCQFSPKQDGKVKWGWIYPLPSGRFQFVEVPGVSSEYDFFDKAGPKEAIVVFANNDKQFFVISNDTPTTLETPNGFYYVNPSTNNLETNKTDGTPFILPSNIGWIGLTTCQMTLLTMASNQDIVEDIADYDPVSNTVSLKLFGNDPHWDNTNFGYVSYFTHYKENQCGPLSSIYCPADKKCIYVKFEPNYCGSQAAATAITVNGQKISFGWILFFVIVFVLLIVYLIKRNQNLNLKHFGKYHHMQSLR